ncbi:MAG: ABC transporter permease [Sandaracinus sp.]|nr:ABC transporter permease [Sandaracinus sp.]MCB9614806.1 ABC transporter permease [Sandaracinus sp.]MCB9631519.1 ABC transporter permease [Sandaracinus sp.]
MIGSLVRIYAIALNTFREAVRDRILLGVVGLASGVLLFSLALGELSLDQQRRVVEDVGLASISLFSVVVAIFLGSSLLYKEIERKTLYVILPRPIHRWEFLVGKHLGIALTGFVFVMVMGGLQLFVMGLQAEGSLALLLGVPVALLAALGLVVWKAKDATTWGIAWAALTLGAGAACAATTEVEVTPVIYALVLNAAEVTLLAAVALFFGAFSTPFLTGAFTAGVWMVGRSADTMQTIHSRLLGDEVVALLHGLARVVPNFNLFVPGRHALHGADVPSYLLTTLGYGVGYTVLALTFASMAFRKRDFP